MKMSYIRKKHLPYSRCFLLTGDFLSSQDVSIQVLSAFECLTTVFGMGTGGSTQLSSPDMLLKDCSGSLLAVAHNA